MKHLTVGLSIIFLFISITGCTSDSWTVDLSSPPSNLNSDPIHPTLTYPDWVEVQPGVSYKQQTVSLGSVEELIHLVRIDQTQATVQLAVDESTPQTVSSWAEQLDASILMNGSYFDENYELVTRTIVAGESYGTLLTGATGVAQKTGKSAPWTITPWSGQAITADNAIQSYPVLVADGVASFTAGSADTAQRTVIALDDDNNLYFIVCEYGVLSLAQLATVLATELDISFTTALNLDGGTSTGLSIQSSDITFTENSLVVPSVLYILPQ